MCSNCLGPAALLAATQYQFNLVVSSWDVPCGQGCICLGSACGPCHACDSVPGVMMRKAQHGGYVHCCVTLFKDHAPPPPLSIFASPRYTPANLLWAGVSSSPFCIKGPHRMTMCCVLSNVLSLHHGTH